MKKRKRHGGRRANRGTPSPYAPRYCCGQGPTFRRWVAEARASGLAIYFPLAAAEAAELAEKMSAYRLQPWGPPPEDGE